MDKTSASDAIPRGTGRFTGDPPVTGPGDITLAAYQEAAGEYLRNSARPGPEQIAYLDHFAGLVGSGSVLEIGTGPGWDADHLEFRGLRIVRTDAAPAFVERLRSAGHDARLLDVRTGDLGGPYQAVLANAVLPHLDRDQFEDVLRRARSAVVAGGILGFTLKEGDGAAWSDHKLGLPRHFTYWREPALRTVLRRTGWRVDFLDHIAVRENYWLRVLARKHSDARDG
jgi:protein-L-isoaspartate O-methyltransferase